MSLQENYVFWLLTNYFLGQENYRLIHLHEEKQELWLDNPNKKDRPVIRIQMRELGWASVVERDVTHVFNVAENLRKQMGRLKLSLVNIYISPFEPVGDKPVFEKIITGKNDKISLQNFLISTEHTEQKLRELENELGIQQGTFSVEGEMTEARVALERQTVINYITKKVTEEQQTARKEKPYITYTFIAMQIAYFLWVFFKDMSLSTFTLVEYGAKFNPLIYQGEWWRLITPIFLHTGLMHIAANCLMLYIVGPWAEKIYGKWRYATILLIGGIAGNIASFALNNNVAVGSSTAVFALFGALLYLVVLKPHLYAKTIGSSIAALVAVNLVIDIFATGIDLAGHVGGLVGGFFLAGALSLPLQYFHWRRLFYGIGFVTLAILFLVMGFDKAGEVQNPAISNSVAQSYFQEGNHKEANKILDYLVETRSADEYSYTLMATEALQNRHYSKAEAAAREAILLNPEIPQAHYILAVTYLHKGDRENALKEAEIAKDLSDEKFFLDFYNQLKNSNQLEGAL
ncbi:MULTISPECIES: rhomboid family intramembrane serine protease [Listeria]|uniref:rhomboid family intramembrane serine protease n=1 Tax=Listeria TaxID=1637 RepID=UPI000B59555B|nr:MULTISPECIES: rhomboid family intramembrane serine protease [Listeria]